MLKVKVKIQLKRSHEGQRGSKVIALLFFSLGALWSLVVETPRTALPPGMTWYPPYRTLGCPRAGAEKLAPPKIRLPHHPAQSVAPIPTRLFRPTLQSCEITKEIIWRPVVNKNQLNKICFITI